MTSEEKTAATEPTPTAQPEQKAADSATPTGSAPVASTSPVTNDTSPVTNEAATSQTSENPTAATPAETTAPAAAATVTPPASQTPPASDERPPNPAPATLRAARFEFLRCAVEHATHRHAVALSATADKRTAAQAEHLEIAKRELTALGNGADWVQLILGLLDKVRNVPLPTPEQLAAWKQLASQVIGLWQQFFAHAKPVDQELNDALHALGNSIEAPSILGVLGQRAELSGKAGALDINTLEAILDGHQSRELEKIGVKPLTILPLVNAVSQAKAMLAAKCEQEKVSAATSA